MAMTTSVWKSAPAPSPVPLGTPVEGVLLGEAATVELWKLAIPGAAS